METKETKVIDLNKYKSSVQNSPLLSGDTVEVKDYTASFNKSASGVLEQKPLEPSRINEAPKQTQTQSQSQSSQQSAYNQNNASSQPFSEPSYLTQYDDGIDPMGLNENPEPEKEKDEEVPTRASEASAMMMISMYSMMVPPIIANMVKTDVNRFDQVLSHNNHIPRPEIDKFEKFLVTNNKEIEKALQLTKEQVVLLKQALAAVIQQYNIAPSNPIVNLLVVVLGIAVTQFMTVRSILEAQNRQVAEFIQNFGVRIPEGMENVLNRKTKIFVKKKQDLQEAA